MSIYRGAEGSLLHLKVTEARLNVVLLRLCRVIDLHNEDALLLARPDPLMVVDPLRNGYIV